MPDETPHGRADFRGSAEATVDLLSRGAVVLEALSRDARIENISAPFLLHPDLHKRNIFVDPQDPTKITAVIDWQSARLDPALLYFQDIPDLCGSPEPSYQPPGSEADRNPEETARQDVAAEDMVICKQAWDAGLRVRAPRLHAAQNTDEALTRPYRYCDSCWTVGATGFRNELVELCQTWTELGLDGSPPFHLTAGELAEHARQWEDFQIAIKLRGALVQLLNTDTQGWVSVEVFEATKEAAAEFFQQWLAAVVESEEMGVDKAKQLWPFDC